MPDAILIAGPTASGKSRLALELARRHGGVVINADSMQVYARTARADGAADAPRTRRPCRTGSTATFRRATRYSVGRWLDDVAAVLGRGAASGAAADRRRRHRPLFQGADRGACRDPADPGRRSASAFAPRPTACRAPALHARLAADRPGGRRAPSGRRTASRIVRALEVFEATGRSLAAWQRVGRGAPLVDRRAAERIVLDAGPRRSSTSASPSAPSTWSTTAALDEVGALGRARPRPGPAGDEGDRRPRAPRPPRRQDLARRGDRRDQDRDPPLRQAPDDLVPQPDGGLARGSTTPAALDLVCRDPPKSELHERTH